MVTFFSGLWVSNSFSPSVMRDNGEESDAAEKLDFSIESPVTVPADNLMDPVKPEEDGQVV